MQYVVEATQAQTSPSHRKALLLQAKTLYYRHPLRQNTGFSVIHSHRGQFLYSNLTDEVQDSRASTLCQATSISKSYSCVSSIAVAVMVKGHATISPVCRPWALIFCEGSQEVQTAMYDESRVAGLGTNACGCAVLRECIGIRIMDTSPGVPAVQRCACVLRSIIQDVEV